MGNDANSPGPLLECLVEECSYLEQCFFRSNHMVQVIHAISEQCQQIGMALDTFTKSKSWRNVDRVMNSLQNESLREPFARVRSMSVLALQNKAEELREENDNLMEQYSQQLARAAEFEAKIKLLEAGATQISPPSGSPCTSSRAPSSVGTIGIDDLSVTASPMPVPSLQSVHALMNSIEQQHGNSRESHLSRPSDLDNYSNDFVTPENTETSKEKEEPTPVIPKEESSNSVVSGSVVSSCSKAKGKGVIPPAPCRSRGGSKEIEFNEITARRWCWRRFLRDFSV